MIRLPCFAALVCGLLPLAEAQQVPAGWRLLDNSGGESPNATRVGSDRGKAIFDVPGWAAVDGGFVAQSGPWYGIEPMEGQVFFRPKPGEAAAIRQIVEITPPEARLPHHVIAGAYARTWKGKDRAELTLTLFDAAGVALAETGSGEIADTKWVWREVWLRVPADATHAAVTLRGIRRDGKLADACFDGVVLETLGAGHPTALAERKPRDLAAMLDAGPDRETRRAILRALAGQGKRGEAPLVDRAGSASDPDERRYALVFAALSGVRDAPALLESASASEDAETRRLALLLIAELDRGGAALLARLVREAGDAKSRRVALDALASRGDREAVRELQKLTRAAGADRIVEVLRAVGRAKLDPDLVYRPLLAPYLDADAESRSRDAAMDALAKLGDSRYLTHLVQLAPAAGTQWQLVRWCRTAADFDSEPALDALVTLVDSRVAHAEPALLASLPRMRVAAAAEWSAQVGVEHESAIVRLAAVRQLRAVGGEDASRALMRACGDADPVVAREAVIGLASSGGRDVGEELARFVTRGEAVVGAAALRALAGLDGQLGVAFEKAREVVTTHRDWQVRVAAAEVLGHRAADHRSFLTAAFDDDVWQVRVAAYRSLATLRSRETVTDLIERMALERGSARAYLADVLADLTGDHRGDDPAVWSKWWVIVGDDFIVPPKSAKRAAAEGAAGRTTTYHGIPVRSDRLVFAIDLSGSMSAEVDGSTKLRVAKDELIAVLRQLRAPQRFGIVGFGTAVHPFEELLLEATAENVERAVSWVDALTLRGSTNVYGALEASLAFPDAEAVFLLTDGEPSVGTYVDTREIRRVVRSLNSERMIRIHTIAVGGGNASRAFLKALAAENAGVFRGE